MRGGLADEERNPIRFRAAEGTESTKRRGQCHAKGSNLANLPVGLSAISRVLQGAL